jgi:hypothetical protein
LVQEPNKATKVVATATSLLLNVWPCNNPNQFHITALICFLYAKMALDLGQVAQLLHATLDPRQHKQGIFQSFLIVFVPTKFLPAEVALKQEENKPNFSLLLLQIVSTEDLPLNTRLAGALCFKNFIKFNWVVGFSTIYACASG